MTIAAMIAVFRAGLNFVNEYADSSKDEASRYHHHDPMIMLKEMLLGRQAKAVWTERPFMAGKPLIRGTDVNANQHHRVQHSKGTE